MSSARSWISEQEEGSQFVVVKRDEIETVQRFMTSIVNDMYNGKNIPAYTNAQAASKVVNSIHRVVGNHKDILQKQVASSLIGWVDSQQSDRQWEDLNEAEQNAYLSQANDVLTTLGVS